jgi:hypothetical protein
MNSHVAMGWRPRRKPRATLDGVAEPFIGYRAEVLEKL